MTSLSRSTRPPAFYHAGQTRMQTLANVRDYAASMESLMFHAEIDDAGHVDIIERALIIYVAYQSSDGSTWITPLVQPPHSSSSKNRTSTPLVSVLTQTSVRVTAADVDAADPINDVLSKSDMLVGLTVMQEFTRDRIRLNGVITKPLRRDRNSHGDVTLSFEFSTTLKLGLCPKYIVDRRITGRRTAIQQDTVVTTSLTSKAQALAIPPAAEALIRRTDTFWIGTTEPTWGSQTSHRGGLPGFVRVTEQPSSLLPRLLWGDYKGNNFFLSLGSALANPQVGLCVIDYENGHVLQLTGVMSIIIKPEQQFDGATRVCQFDIQQWRYCLHAIPFTFKTISLSVHSPQLSTNNDVQRKSNGKVMIRLVEIERKATDIKAFRFIRDATLTSSNVLLQWLPAQYAVIRLNINGSEEERSWTITSLSSSSRSNSVLELTIKRAEDGFVSHFLHDRAEIGMTFELVGIEGTFSTPSMYWTDSLEGISAVTGRPLNKLWLSGGIGITPLIAHLRTYARFHKIHAAKNVSVPLSDVLWLHVDKTLEHVPALDDMVRLLELSQASGPTQLKVHIVIALTQCAANERESIASHFQHLVDTKLLSDHCNIKLIFGRPTSSTLSDVYPTVSIRNRSVDACGSVALIHQFRLWNEQWKADGNVTKSFRTESFSY